LNVTAKRDTIEVIEAVTNNASSYRSSNKIIISDGSNLVYFPPGEDEQKFLEYVKRPLKLLRSLEG
jgi:hypothetical protein